MERRARNGLVMTTLLLAASLPAAARAERPSLAVEGFGRGSCSRPGGAESAARRAATQRATERCGSQARRVSSWALSSRCDGETEKARAAALFECQVPTARARPPEPSCRRVCEIDRNNTGCGAHYGVCLNCYDVCS
jgi:hypothetical protein